MKEINQYSKIINLCGKQGCCPVVERIKKEVKIGEKENLCVLKKAEWEILKRKVKENQAKVIIEAANIPMREEIEEELFKKGILIAPDFLANAGGVISSFAEWRGYNPK